ncbi:M23 family metallopeptidase [Ruixingdingia sedimenti]|uniref:M23 family metallopeptidase n=1 Tax=Ruixingdingia sedimenti TaxID=3073604 RepID=A0ABU1FEM2_9RHOB|nr:M23 family metallopeptidase [Xinfangfangia sp. LG-4]MDR5654924.1 M23 family metallopeptidase [Xinfangfangia sp. LG-4]
MIRRAACALFAAAAWPAAAQPVMHLPVDCALGETCFIQNYPDHDPGPGFSDFTCGPLGYDGHDGTDFALLSLAAMQAGVAVLAPADGVVTGTRDGMQDIAVNDPAAPPLDGRDCGNGLAIDHGGGWVSQLCHLAQGSVTVRTGDRVTAGQPVGRVGLSGRTEFPHVHLSLRQGDRKVDPFAPDPAAACGGPAQPGLWAAPIAYAPGGLVGAGITDHAPDYAAIQSAPPATTPLPRSAPALVAWALLYGTRSGDRLAMRLTGPDGTVAEDSSTVERTQARSYRYIGRRAPPGGWPAGDYRASLTLTRGGTVIARHEARVTVGP